ncbi:ABC transporter ATP-binding protein [Schlesneria paludicola]|uniref:ABC transporter ATP-binding protein n=1 Tax=Schlesneria paludicola TaxID=360056 RepID=UPI00029AFD6B|nr:ABC transporter ATP-binding protein [Schlesneria paludicola]
MTDPALLEITGLKTYFHSDGGTVKAVDDLTIKIREGETLGLVGESGSGKSVTSLTIMRLLPDIGAKIEAGRIAFLGKDLVQLPRAEMRHMRGKDLSMIFQEPGTSLNPVYRVGDQVAEAMRLHEKISRTEAMNRAQRLFEEVGIPSPKQSLLKYPHEMSGGQKQRVMIAMALACNPKLLIADEPTTALDVTIQAQILDLIRKLRDERGMAILFITHDLGVIAEIADEVAVMYRGKLVEYDTAKNVFTRPQHPYTKGLLACRPRLDTTRRRLPTVADYMESTKDSDGNLIITEKALSPARLAEIEGRGRGRLLHPRAESSTAATVSPTASKEYVAAGQSPLLSVSHLRVYYPIKQGLLRRTIGYNKAVDDISFDVYKGQTLGLVGESGCGKTTTGRAILRLLPITSGTVMFEGINWSSLRGAELRRERRRMQIVFQDPYSSLNPRMTVEAMLTEAMSVHRIGKHNRDRQDRAAQLLEEVGLLSEHLHRYPHEFSGGQRQRLCIARSLAVEPDFLICDESVSALDVSVQAQVLNLLKDLQERRGLTYVFISHDLSVVKFMSDMMAVMNAGKIVEFGPSDEIYANPQNEYTRKLISAIPQPTIEALERRERERAQRGASKAIAPAPK